MCVGRGSLFWVLSAVLSIGCASEIDHGPVLGSDLGTASEPRHSSDATNVGGATTSTTVTSACDAGGSWAARPDFAFERSNTGDEFSDEVNALVRLSDVPPVAVSSHIDPRCVWVVAFSAPEGADAIGAGHPATFTPMLRHPAGLWTAAPQSTGWLRIVDRASRAVWIPMVEVTGAATYGEASCASLSAVRVSATVPPSASALRLTTAAGERTVRDLMGSEPSSRGWNVRFTFSADIAR